MDTTAYKREQALATHGILVRRANHFEAMTNEYGDKLRWVIDLGGERQALHAYRTKKEAIAAAEAYLP